MKFRPLFSIVALGAALGWSAAAADEPSTRVLRPEERMLAYTLLEVAGTPRTMELTLQNSLDAQLQSNPQLLPFRHVFESYLRRTISYEAQKEELARTYLELYTLDEIRELIRFYQTPIGRKKAAADAKISVALAEVTRRKMAENLPQFQQQLQQEMQKQQLLQQPEQAPAGPVIPSPEQP